jgi:hypothetical protein
VTHNGEDADNAPNEDEYAGSLGERESSEEESHG